MALWRKVLGEAVASARKLPVPLLSTSGKSYRADILVRGQSGAAGRGREFVQKGLDSGTAPINRSRLYFDDQLQARAAYIRQMNRRELIREDPPDSDLMLILKTAAGTAWKIVAGIFGAISSIIEATDRVVIQLMKVVWIIFLILALQLMVQTAREEREKVSSLELAVRAIARLKRRVCDEEQKSTAPSTPGATIPAPAPTSTQLADPSRAAAPPST